MAAGPHIPLGGPEEPSAEDRDETEEWPEDRIQQRFEEIERATATTGTKALIGGDA